MHEEYTSPMAFKKSKDLFSGSLARYTKPKTKATSERAELVEKFVTRLNNSRLAGGYKPLAAKFYATKMAHIPTDELFYFYKKCDQANNFSKVWWWTCCPKKK